MLDRAALAALGVDDALIATRRRLDGDRRDRVPRERAGAGRARQREFGLADARIMPGGALSAVLACTRIADGRPVVLKLSRPAPRRRRGGGRTGAVGGRRRLRVAGGEQRRHRAGA